ncbi:related to integral membrane protein [Phialocephala subalpina]|uniref:Related to integral membrane protein n=1 Tax=Phialocephala subalpina TaxID=576137 RepID=A0A1L7WX79_9HELO|nr:related to integral membrane protein [Phialocephala subalpina]
MADNMLPAGRRSSENYERHLSSLLSSSKPNGFRASAGLENIARRTLGITLLLTTVFIFADNTYSKPYFVTYVNTATFAISLVPIMIRLSYEHGFEHVRTSCVEFWRGSVNQYRAIGTKSEDREDDAEDAMSASQTRLLVDNEGGVIDALPGDAQVQEQKLNLQETAKLSLEFCLLWFVANYLVSACLEYTSVASSTILTSTSSIWTLMFGAFARVEHFSFKKLIGVFASLVGIILISTVDLSGKDNDENRGNFPHKSKGEIALGDAMALGSAVVYGMYIVVMKKRVGNEDRVNMPLFFGLVGFFNLIFLWPGLFILHWTGVEPFALPPTGRVWTIVLVNAVISLVSDFAWAYALLLTTPLVVTVGISMTIPLSLIGQMVLSAQYSSATYWVGACIVLSSFLFINYETREDSESHGPQNVVYSA